MEINEKIVKKGSKWQVQSEKGRNMGTYDTKKEAKKRLCQVEYFKHINESEKQIIIDYKGKSYNLPNDFEDLIIDIAAVRASIDELYYFNSERSRDRRASSLYVDCFNELSHLLVKEDVVNDIDEFLKNSGILTSRQLFLDIIDGIDEFNAEDK